MFAKAKNGPKTRWMTKTVTVPEGNGPHAFELEFEMSMTVFPSRAEQEWWKWVHSWRFKPQMPANIRDAADAAFLAGERATGEALVARYWLENRDRLRSEIRKLRRENKLTRQSRVKNRLRTVWSHPARAFADTEK